MERYVKMEDISDGKRYGSNDMAKLGCNECEGCSECCHNVGESIILDPWDVYMLETYLSCGFEGLLGKYLELKVFQGVILPYLLLDEKDGCHFLNEEERCSIHGFRPGFCRLFPLGRIYENGSFSYFLQTQECKKERRTKVKISKWLGIPNLASYEKYICQWHYLVKDVQELAKQMEGKELKEWNLYLLQAFFAVPYEEGDFYMQFQKRYEEARKRLDS
jgi:Predicted Fe-S-cluster oxidoreductase